MDSAFYQFPEHFLLLLPNIEQKRIPLNDNINRCKQLLQGHQRFVKKWKLFLVKCPEIFVHKTFLFSQLSDFTYFLKNISLKKIRET